MDWLDSLGIEYEEVDASDTEDIKSVPITEIGETRIIGLDRPAILKALKKAGITQWKRILFLSTDFVAAPLA